MRGRVRTGIAALWALPGAAAAAEPWQEAAWHRGDCLVAAGCKGLTHGQHVVAAELGIGMDDAGHEPRNITVIDIERHRAHECLDATLTRTERERCQPDEVTRVGCWFIVEGVLFVGLLLALAELVGGQGASKRFWSALALYWSCDFLVCLSCGVYAHVWMETGGALNVAQLATAMLFELVLYRMPMMVAKRCFPRYFLISAAVLSTWPLFQTMPLAYRPSGIALYGHHPLQLGLVTFLVGALATLWVVWGRRTLGCYTAEEYYNVMNSEVGRMLLDLAAPIPRQVVHEALHGKS